MKLSYISVIVDIMGIHIPRNLAIKQLNHFTMLGEKIRIVAPQYKLLKLIFHNNS